MFLGEIFLQGKEDWFRTDYQLGNPTLGDLLACWSPARGGSGFKLGMVLSHGWVEHGSCQVIWSSNRGQIYIELLMLVI